MTDRNDPIVDETEDKGIEAIIFLQSLVGIVESREQATVGWRAMRDWEKASTMRTYRLLKPA